MTDLLTTWFLDIMQSIYVKLMQLSHKTKLTRTLNEKSVNNKNMTFLQFQRKIMCKTTGGHCIMLYITEG
jgi:hypothetical protein